MTTPFRDGGVVWQGGRRISSELLTPPKKVTVTRVPVSSLTSSRLYLASVDENETAKAMQEYMSRSHEEKLKTLQILREKEVEIEKLKKDLDNVKVQLKESSSSLPSGTVKDGSESESTGNDDDDERSKGELLIQISAYQNFMSDYIVKAQEDKLRAVKEAELSVKKKYDALIAKSGSDDVVVSAAVATTSAAVASKESLLPPLTAEGELYTKRNARVIDSAKIGKSRWGDAEVKRIGGGPASSAAAAAVGTSTAASSPAAPPSAESVAPVVVVVPKEIPPEVIAADHGLRADGGVGGLTLAERVLGGCNAKSATDTTSSAASSSSSTSPSSSLYAKRNARIIQAAKVGKSRWGPMEIARIEDYITKNSETMSSSSVPTKSSTTKRVNFGAQLVG